jgi:hypothetical protein
MVSENEDDCVNFQQQQSLGMTLDTFISVVLQAKDEIELELKIRQHIDNFKSN